MCWRSTWIIELTDEIYWVACGCTRVCNPCGCNRSFYYTDEMCWRVMWMYFTASHSTTRTIYTGGPCGCTRVVHAGQLSTRTRCTGGSCGCTCVVQAVHVLCRSFKYTSTRSAGDPKDVLLCRSFKYTGQMLLGVLLDVFVLCRSFNYTHEMYWKSMSMWLCMCYAYRSRCTGGQCGCTL